MIFADSPRATAAPWSAISAVALIETVWAWFRGASFLHVGLYIAATGLLLALAAILRVRCADRFARVVHAMALFLSFLTVAVPLSFLCASIDLPLQDAHFAAIDKSLGFDWSAYASAVSRHPLLEAVLDLAYLSYVPQFAAAICYHAYATAGARALELFWQLLISLCLTMSLFALFPASGPWVEYHVLTQLDSFPVTYLATLRAGGLHVIDLLQVDGIITFPSFHAVYAVLLTYIYRGRRFFLPALAMNAVMLASLPSAGGHYLIDVLGGLTVASVAIAACSVYQRKVLWSATPRASAPGTGVPEW
jgi:hypothetical protein